ncbi:MAG TPA: TIGR00730 family Rossman fold protein, partial [Polyangiaceae bacterium]|nr:TIGR00730 family Rossman fold protein [Polyangiaceae bacterium]
MRALCVFCGSSHGQSAIYASEAEQFGRLLAEQDITLVWGGGHIGLMGVVADAVLEGGGRTIGVIPSFMVERELAHPRSTEMVVVGSMHERKAKMAELADAFAVLPGGYGTLEEFFEVLTWAQLGLHRKPIGLLNVSGFFDPLLDLVRHQLTERFVQPEHLDLFFAEPNAATLL